MNNIVEAIIEIPLKTKNKFEVDKQSKKIKLDRVLYSAMTYPAEYGFIDNTLELDGDPLDILVLSTEATFPGCVIPARIIGNLKLTDRGLPDNKIIAVVAVDPRFDNVNELDDLSDFTRSEIKNFFEHYKDLQNIEVIVDDYEGKEQALAVVEKCRKRYQDKLKG